MQQKKCKIKDRDYLSIISRQPFVIISYLKATKLLINARSENVSD